ncbi:hypothetical protein BGW37DRAFT_490493 [Umbelopsis sp. PMI_123]|jgi:hypothetical protein|nr:hypothetical protein BGW37DRAFT_490493 [Umbelopsis sp. PMI_123]
MTNSTFNVSVKANFRERVSSSDRRARSGRIHAYRQRSFKAAITATLSDLTNQPSRSQRTRQARRSNIHTKSEMKAALSLNTKENEFDDVFFNVEMKMALDELDEEDREDEVFLNEFEAKLHLGYQECETQDLTVNEDDGNNGPYTENPISSSRTNSSLHADSNSRNNHSNLQPQDNAVLNARAPLGHATESDNKVANFDEYDDLESYEEFVNQADKASYLKQEDNNGRLP